MTTTTKTEIHRVIFEALGDRSALLRRDVASRKFTGPRFADVRAKIRAEAELCEYLMGMLGHVSPEALASVFAAKEA